MLFGNFLSGVRTFSTRVHTKPVSLQNGEKTGMIVFVNDK